MKIKAAILAAIIIANCRDGEVEATKVETIEEAKTVYTTIRKGESTGVIEDDFDPNRVEKIVAELVEIRKRPDTEKLRWALSMVDESNAAIRRALFSLTSEDIWILPGLSRIVRKEYLDPRAQAIQIDAVYVSITRFPSHADKECEFVLSKESHPAVLICAEFFAFKNMLEEERADKLFATICNKLDLQSFGFLSSPGLRDPRDLQAPRVVFHVCKGSVAMQAGIRRGDVIEKVDGVKMNSDESYAVIQDKSKRRIVLGVSRVAGTVEIVLERR